MSTKRETVEQKGWRLFTSGAVDKIRAHKFDVVGDHGRYTVEDGRCNCPAYSRCSHEVAVDHARGITPAPVETIEISAEVLAALLRLELETRAFDGDVFGVRRTLDETRRASSGEETEELIGMFA